MPETDPAASEPHVLLIMALRGRDMVGIARGVEALGTNGRQHLDRADVRQMLSASDDDVAFVVDWLQTHGFRVFEVRDAKLVFFLARRDPLVDAFGPRAGRWFDDARSTPPSTWPLPPELAPRVENLLGKDPRSTARIESEVDPSQLDGFMQDGRAEHVPDESWWTTTETPPAAAFTPEDIRGFYQFPEPSALDGAGQTVSILVVGVQLDIEVLKRFWAACGVKRTGKVILDEIWPAPPAYDPVYALEAYMTVEWIGAMAPGADLKVYCFNATFANDIHAAVLLAALFDTEDAPCALATSWTMPEQDYARSYGLTAFEGLLDAAALAGLTVVCASGDWGAYHGRPEKRAGSTSAVCFTAWPQATFPANCERVLGIGGSMITAREPLTEVIWSGPLPPDPGLRAAVPLTMLATSGGFSEAVPIPAYQGGVVTQSAPYPRGHDLPAVVAFGRGIPDVSLAASGASIIRPGDTEPSSLGYAVLSPEGWADFGGGTSTASPIWAAIIGLLNQRLAAEGLPAIGQPHDLFYAVAADRDADAFRPVAVGRSDVELKALLPDNRTRPYVLPGFQARTVQTYGTPTPADQWNPATGLGVPRVTQLIDAVTARMHAAARPSHDSAPG